MYNNIGDFWYETVIANENQVSYTSPYFDPIAKQLMVTIGRVLHNPQTGGMIGAFGGDLILSSIQNDIRELVYSEFGRSIMFEKNTGYVIADSRNTTNNLITYQNINNPIISDDDWEKINNNQNDLLEIGNFYVVSGDLATSNGQYCIISIVPKNYVLNSFDNIISESDKLIKADIIVVIVIFFVITILALFLVVVLTHHIGKSFQYILDESQKVIKRFGNLQRQQSIKQSPQNISRISECSDAIKRIQEIGMPMTVSENITDNKEIYPWSSIKEFTERPLNVNARPIPNHLQGTAPNIAEYSGESTL